MRLFEIASLTDGDAYFSEKAWDFAGQMTGYKSRGIVIHMSPDEFLYLAESTNIYTSGKLERVTDVLKQGGKFDSIPYIGFANDGNGGARVTGHEGRHRVAALRAIGVKTVPVMFESREAGDGPGIRWDVQIPDTFDFIKVWPQTLTNQDGNGTIPFPVKQDLKKFR